MTTDLRPIMVLAIVMGIALLTGPLEYANLATALIMAMAAISVRTIARGRFARAT